MRRRAESSRCAPKEALGGALRRSRRSLLVTLLLTAFGSVCDSTAGPDRSRRFPRRASPPGLRAPQVVALQSTAQAPAARRPEPRDGDRLPRPPPMGRSPWTRSAGRRTRGLSARVARSIFGGGTRRLATTRSAVAGARRRPSLDVGAAPGTDVYAPVDGTIVGITPLRPVGQALRRSTSTSSPAATPSIVAHSPTCGPTRALTVGSPGPRPPPRSSGRSSTSPRSNARRSRT